MLNVSLVLKYFFLEVQQQLAMNIYCMNIVWFSESEDEVEELEERVPSPDVAPEESAPFYDPAAWYVLNLSTLSQTGFHIALTPVKV